MPATFFVDFFGEPSAPGIQPPSDTVASTADLDATIVMAKYDVRSIRQWAIRFEVHTTDEILYRWPDDENA
jgi:hypothetical protein